MLLTCNHLTVKYNNKIAVSDVSFSLESGKCLALVGESGSGKTSIVRAVGGLLPDNSTVAGNIVFDGQDLLSLSREEHRCLMGEKISYIFQNSGASLDPSKRIGAQFEEFICCHRDISKAAASKIAAASLRRVGLNDIDRILKVYPEQLSGGMKQRIAIAMAMTFEPGLLLADEPTSALDSVLQAQILQEIELFKSEYHTAVVFVTHNIRAAFQIADYIGVVKEGHLLETGITDQIKLFAQTEYSQKLLASRMTFQKSQNSRSDFKNKAKFSLSNVSKIYRILGRTRKIAALRDVSLDIYENEIFGIAGESGCGKSTMTRLLTGVEQPTAGKVMYEGRAVTRADRNLLREIQLVFQEPDSMFSPRMKVGTILAEPLKNYKLADKGEIKKRIAESLSKVFLPENYADRFPGTLSGGELQRVSIIKSTEINPKVIIYDEPTSSLDASIQRHMLDLIIQTHEQHQLTTVIVSHDVVQLQNICSRIAILYRGRVVEILPGNKINSCARHPYTKLLVAAASGQLKDDNPMQISDLNSIDGSLGDGCVFYHRCLLRRTKCLKEAPPLLLVEHAHLCACFAMDENSI